MTYLRQPITTKKKVFFEHLFLRKTNISVLGHVSQQFIINSWTFCQSQKDHRKVSLLDYVRKSNITAKKAGGLI